MAKKSTKSYITIYADEQTYDAWRDYCNACGVPRDATKITVFFNEKDVMYAE